jgi:arabinoxylan arabinofuranohydrolase
MISWRVKHRNSLMKNSGNFQRISIFMEIKSFSYNSSICALVLLLVVLTNLQADYPVASHRYLADPSVLVTEDRVYVYCSNDDENPTGEGEIKGCYVIPNVICVSSSDMKNWTDHGSVFRAEESTTWAKKTWAPAVAARDGKCFLYYGNGGANIGVAVSNSPIGPFADPVGACLIDDKTPGVMPAEHMWLFDPAVFVDDDGQAYIYFGGNGADNVRVAKLNRDMTSLDGEVLKMSAPNFFEAAWVFKRNGVYYFAYSTTPKTGMRIDYTMSSRPTSGFTYAGILAGQPPINSNNNHAAEFQFKGEWYHIYHNRIVAKQAGIPPGFRRNLGIEKFSFNVDGTVKPVEYTTDGVPQAGWLNPYARVEGETFNAQHGIKTERCSEGGLNVTNIRDGAWIKIKGVDFGSKGPHAFDVAVASGGGGGRIKLYLDSLAGQLIGTCSVANTGGWQSWRTVSCEVENVTGVQDLYLKFEGGIEPLFNLDYWQFR